jgi:hypothetical protein
MPRHTYIHSKLKPKSKAEQELDDIRKKLRESKRKTKAFRMREKAAGIDLEARARKHEEQAAEMGITSTELGLLKYGHLEAELSAKPDETLEQTMARGNELGHKMIEEWKAQDRDLIRVIMSLPEKQRRKLLAEMRSRM